MALNKDEFLKKWKELPVNRRILIAGGGGLCFVLALGILFGSPAPNEQQAAHGKSQSNFSIPVNKDLSIEQMAAQMESLRQGQVEEKQARERLETLLADKAKSGTGDPLTADVVRELRELRVDLDGIKAQKASGPGISLDDQLPPDNASSASGRDLVTAQPMAEPEPDDFRVTGGKRDKNSEQEDRAAEQPLAYLPAGSNFEGVLLNGMDAPTSGAAKSNPTPALVRLDTDAILPSRHRYDVRECFALVTGFGVMSTERAQLQTTTISCVKTDGSVIESKLEGYVVGEDGKVGLRGRLVTKNGSLLAKSFMTGFFAGIGQSLAPMAVPQLNVSPGGTQQYQAPNVSQVLTSGTAQGVTNSARSISQFYLDMAKEVFPVIEIDAMRRVTIILVRGVELSMIGEKK